MSACLLNLFINKLNAYEPELTRRYIIPEVQEDLWKRERVLAEKREQEHVFRLRKEWLSHQETWEMLEDGGWAARYGDIVGWLSVRDIEERCQEIETEICDDYHECLFSREEFDNEYSEFVDEATPDRGYCPRLDGSVMSLGGRGVA